MLLKVLSCGLERSLSISAPQIPLGSKRLELWVDPGLQTLVVWPYCHSHTILVWLWKWGIQMAWDQATPGAHFQEVGGVLICSGCYNTIPQTRHLINNRNVFLTVVGDCKPMIRVPAWSGSAESPLLDCWLLPVSHIVEGMREHSGASFIMALIPIMRALLSSPSHLPKVPTS